MAWPARVHGGADCKTRCTAGRVRQGAAHGDAASIALPGKVALLTYLRREVEAAKEAHDGPRATGGIGFAALHGRKQRVARVLFRPDDGQATAVGLEPQKVGLIQNLPGDGKARVAVSTGLGILHLVGGAGRAVVVIESADKAELERIHPVRLLV